MELIAEWRSGADAGAELVGKNDETEGHSIDVELLVVELIHRLGMVPVDLRQPSVDRGKSFRRIDVRSPS